MVSRLVSRGPVAGSSRSVPQKNIVFYYTILGGKKWAFFTDNGRHAGRLGYFLEYVNRINLRAEMEQGVL